MDYRGVKIPEKIIIVENTYIEENSYNWKGRTINQGYVVDVGNKKMLESAMNWARWTKSDDVLYAEFIEANNAYCKNRTLENIAIKEEKYKKYEASKQVMEGVIHEYENGDFEIFLDESAGRSSQGGKLSFWNCIIKAPDNKSYLIGINSELLLHLMMKNTLINGACQNKVWLGRVYGQVGVFTSNMEDFEQAKKDEKSRSAKKTKNYVPGDVVETLTSREIYLGEFYRYATVYSYPTDKRDMFWRPETKRCMVLHKPKKVYGYVYKEVNGKYALSYDIEFRETKAPRVITGHEEQICQRYCSYIENYRDEALKLKIKDPDTYSGFDNFIKDIVFRTTDNISLAEIREDVSNLVAYYRTVYNKDDYYPEGYFSSIIRFEDEVSTKDEENFKLEDWILSRFSNYNQYYKDEDK